MVTITFTKQERKALRKNSTHPIVCFYAPPWDTGSMGGVRVTTYSNRVVIFSSLINRVKDQAVKWITLGFGFLHCLPCLLDIITVSAKILTTNK